jgi:hypothetical protein
VGSFCCLLPSNCSRSLARTPTRGAVACGQHAAVPIIYELIEIFPIKHEIVRDFCIIFRGAKKILRDLSQRLFGQVMQIGASTEYKNE